MNLLQNNKMVCQVAQLLALAGTCMQCVATDITGDAVTVHYEVTSAGYHFEKTITIPDSFTYPEVDASATFYFLSDRIIVDVYDARWTAGGFNGFTLTDLNRTFTAFALESIVGDNPNPTIPAVSFNAHTLTVNFTPGGVSSFGQLIYTFPFSTESVPDSTSTFPLVAAALGTLAWIRRIIVRC